MEELHFWHWWILGLLLLLPGTQVKRTGLTGTGIAAACVGTLVLFFPGMFWERQLAIFVLAALVVVFLLRLSRRRSC